MLGRSRTCVMAGKTGFDRQEPSRVDTILPVQRGLDYAQPHSGDENDSVRGQVQSCAQLAEPVRPCPNGGLVTIAPDAYWLNGGECGGQR